MNSQEKQQLIKKCDIINEKLSDIAGKKVSRNVTEKARACMLTVRDLEIAINQVVTNNRK